VTRLTATSSTTTVVLGMRRASMRSQKSVAPGDYSLEVAKPEYNRSETLAKHKNPGLSHRRTTIMPAANPRDCTRASHHSVVRSRCMNVSHDRDMEGLLARRTGRGIVASSATEWRPIPFAVIEQRSVLKHSDVQSTLGGQHSTGAVKPDEGGPHLES